MNWVTGVPVWLWVHWWPHIWPIITGCAIGQVVNLWLLRLRTAAEVEAHHIAQLAHTNRVFAELRAELAELRDELRGANQS